MHLSIRPALMSLLVAGALPLASAWAQAPAPNAEAGTSPAKNAAPAPAAKAEAPPKPANLDQVLATVNGEKITRGELLNFLSRYQVSQAKPETIYHDAIESLINAHLLGQFLARQQI